MKYPRQVSMPSGIQLWLEEQLEARGIDSSVYTKYILGVLCNESSDQPIKPKDCGVKNLIDELKVTLKEHKEKGHFLNFNSAVYKSFEDNCPQSTQEKANRFQTAFPPLTPKSKADRTHLSFGSSSNIWSGKRSFGSSVGKNRTFSEGNNRDNKLQNSFELLDENKENAGFNRDVREKMRSRSTVKQQTPEKTYRNMAKSLDRKEDFNRNSETRKSRRLYQQSNEMEGNKHIQALWDTEKSFDDLSGCDQDLPMDFQQLLESPESTKLTLDFSRCIGAKQPSSFIQCGTNITSSIWSEKAEDTMDCSMIGDSNNDLTLNLAVNKSAWGQVDDNLLGGNEMLQDSVDCLKPNLWTNEEATKYDDAPWKTVGNLGNKDHLGSYGKWSDIESTSLLLNDTDTFFSSMGSNLHCSLTTLNHNKEDSSFTEVIPKMQSSLFNVAINKKNLEPTPNFNETTKKEEEDLLTSMKTHFRPIKQDTIEVVPSTTAPKFPDGTTFPISNSLEKPDFHRSPGGGLYLDSNVNNKYMEFNDTEDDTPSEFVPKFKVCQNEKFCQTEDGLFAPKRQDESDYKELCFPEDEKLVRNMVEEEEEVEEDDNVFWRSEACIKVDGWMATWPATGIWSNEPNVQQIWCGGNLWNTSVDSVELEKAGENTEVKSGDQYTRLRNEWTQEAEELLSDISQQLYLANYMETQPPQLVEAESQANELSVAPRGVSRNRKRRHWSSQHGAPSVCQQPPSQGSRPLTL